MYKLRIHPVHYIIKLWVLGINNLHCTPRLFAIAYFYQFLYGRHNLKYEKYPCFETYEQYYYVLTAVIHTVRIELILVSLYLYLSVEWNKFFFEMIIISNLCITFIWLNMQMSFDSIQFMCLLIGQLKQLIVL